MHSNPQKLCCDTRSFKTYLAIIVVIIGVNAVARYTCDKVSFFKAKILQIGIDTKLRIVKIR